MLRVQGRRAVQIALQPTPSSHGGVAPKIGVELVKHFWLVVRLSWGRCGTGGPWTVTLGIVAGGPSPRRRGTSPTSCRLIVCGCGRRVFGAVLLGPRVKPTRPSWRNGRVAKSRPMWATSCRWPSIVHELAILAPIIHVRIEIGGQIGRRSIPARILVGRGMPSMSISSRSHVGVVVLKVGVAGSHWSCTCRTGCARTMACHAHVGRVGKHGRA